MFKNNSRGNRRNGQKANYQSRKKETVNTHNNQGANNNTAAEQPTRKSRRNTDPIQLLNAQVMRKFKNLPADLQSTATKVSCINTVLAAHKEKCGDPARYYGWLLSRAAEITRTFDFAEVCKKAGLKADEHQAVSEHLVLEGKSVCNQIRLNGLATYDGNIRMFRDRLVPEQYWFNKPAEQAEAEEATNE